MFTDKINAAQPGQKVELDKSECYYYSSITFRFDSELGFTWSAVSRHHPHNVRPMQSKHIVKFFKSLDGAKRNFIKRVADEHERLGGEFLANVLADEAFNAA